MKKILKKNQIIIYVIALMLVTAGYLNYTSVEGDDYIETSIKLEGDDMQIADIGDATLVNSNDVVSSESENNVSDDEHIVENNVVAEENGSENIVSDDFQANFSNDENTTLQTNSNISDEYFTKSKLERDTMYSQMIETYEKVLNSSNSLETQKQSATQEITKINETKNKIMICENLIKTKGFENCVIFVNGESISIIIGAGEIKTEEIAQIQNIISREMGVGIENIHISNK